MGAGTIEQTCQLAQLSGLGNSGSISNSCRRKSKARDPCVEVRLCYYIWPAYFQADWGAAFLFFSSGGASLTCSVTFPEFPQLKLEPIMPALSRAIFPYLSRGNTVSTMLNTVRAGCYLRDSYRSSVLRWLWNAHVHCSKAFQDKIA